MYLCVSKQVAHAVQNQNVSSATDAKLVYHVDGDINKCWE